MSRAPAFKIRSSTEPVCARNLSPDQDNEIAIARRGRKIRHSVANFPPRDKVVITNESPSSSPTTDCLRRAVCEGTSKARVASMELDMRRNSSVMETTQMNIARKQMKPPGTA
eukprot:TRINITY_DN102906_c0_g1_i1.p2 TRINITY_DN102906_c0_g1~~TRINITY_DN102906_c0_g1_i1.p2  ORF type:complete len:113 (+),score=6.65 TRINITY_DN102906_c0_g1_i1:93-431(+)